MANGGGRTTTDVPKELWDHVNESGVGNYFYTNPPAGLSSGTLNEDKTLISVSEFKQRLGINKISIIILANCILHKIFAPEMRIPDLHRQGLS